MGKVLFHVVPAPDIITRCGETASSSATVKVPLLASVSGAHLREANPVFELAKAPSTKSKFRVHKIKGDGRCLFRAIAQGLARSKGVSLLGPEETEEADLLRMAVHNALCAEKPRKEYHPAIRSAHVDAPMPTYCARLQSPTFWGGDPELLCLAQMLKTPIFVYLSEKEQGTGTGFVPIMKYGEQFLKKGKTWKARRPLRVLHTGGNHYDLLLA